MGSYRETTKNKKIKTMCLDIMLQIQENVILPWKPEEIYASNRASDKSKEFAWNLHGIYVEKFTWSPLTVTSPPEQMITRYIKINFLFISYIRKIKHLKVFNIISRDV